MSTPILFRVYEGVHLVHCSALVSVVDGRKHNRLGLFLLIRRKVVRDMKVEIDEVLRGKSTNQILKDFAVIIIRPIRARIIIRILLLVGRGSLWLRVIGAAVILE